MNFKQFKKIAEDKHSATMLHPDGHQMKIAKSHLSAKLRKELEDLPTHKAAGGKVRHFAEGGDSSEPMPPPPSNVDTLYNNSAGETPQKDTPPIPPENSANTASSEDLEKLKQTLLAEKASKDDQSNAAPLDDASPAQLTDSSTPADTSTTNAAPTEPAPADVTLPPLAPVVPEPSMAGQLPSAMAADLKTQDAAWGKDLTDGHITPETFHSLWEKKDTLGKVGTIFGLLLSGAGSGLTHQPNTLLTMMQSQINNDLEAQKSSKVNAQNFIQLNQAHQLQIAQIEKMVHENRLTDSQAKEALINAKTKANALARMQANRVALHSLILKVQTMPVGSAERQQAEQQLGMISQSVQNENFDIADRAAASAALGSSLSGSAQNGSQDPEAAFKANNTMLRVSGYKELADDREAKHFPGVAGQASVPLTADDREKINSGITFQNQLQRFQEWTKNHSGDLNPSAQREGEALAKGLQGAYRNATNGGVYKQSENNFIGSIIDDEPTKFFNKIRVAPQLGAVQTDSAAQLNQLLKSKGFQGYAGTPSDKGVPQYKIVNGVKYMRGPNGEAIRVK